ncbi:MULTISPECIES: TetR/AcrR family transcriptional regulator [unclassified Aureimonas]|uniref:TetR/AcrR family transcriptional regulator n=1 Tax=unclassified Aureimonas TaxID=2615206 RepID=UPI0006FD757B|nr:MULTISPECIES: TetR/AcrR family transcriptional regulator [unclassified Aureimonas]KQT61249.1 hypothetical protein ASG54_24225 [Aureimonas sp. Leaf460]KQT68698.1 hypothetical protein ASG62_18985 [Aureimonas sp. Leaf427]
MTLKSDKQAEMAESGTADVGDAFDPHRLDQDNPKVRQLLEAAGRLFMQLPYEAVSTDAIAREAKVSKATLYAYFSSKENLFSTLIGARCNKIADDVWDSSSELGDVRHELCRFGRQFVELLEQAETMRLYRSVVSQTVRFPELGERFYEAGPKRFELRLAEFLSEATRRGLLRVDDPGLGAIQFVQLMAGDVPTRGLLGIAPNAPGTTKRRIESGIDLFLAGYGPEPTTGA